MRVDSAAPRTWLLATLAGWALLLWLLALLGMGSSIATLKDVTTLQPVAQLRTPPPERIGPLVQYSETASRPLFSEDRRPQPFSLQPEGEVAQATGFDFVLTSVLLAPGLQMAIVQPSAGGESVRMKLGEAPDDARGWRLVELHPRSAVFEGPEGQKSLDLRTFDGTGGEAPTTVARPQPQDAAGRPATTAVPPVAMSPPKPTVATPTPPKPAATTPAGAAPMTPEAQMDAIRKRIEARRAQLRAEAQQQQPAKQP